MQAQLHIHNNKSLKKGQTVLRTRSFLIPKIIYTDNNITKLQNLIPTNIMKDNTWSTAKKLNNIQDPSRNRQVLLQSGRSPLAAGSLRTSRLFSCQESSTH